MQGLVLTQSGYLPLFYLLEKKIRPKISGKPFAYYISGRRYYDRFLSQKPREWPSGRSLNFEWSILEAAKKIPCPESVQIEEIERDLNCPSLWEVISADRRLFFGPKSVFTQDYVSSYTHQDLQKIIWVAKNQIQKHLDRVKPDFILSFICVTFGEYLYFLFAKARNIPFLNLRNTRIENFMTVSEDIFEPASNLMQRYQKMKDEEVPENINAFSNQWVSNLKVKRNSYEGQDYLKNMISKAPFSLKKVSRLPRQIYRTIKRKDQASRMVSR